MRHSTGFQKRLFVALASMLCFGAAVLRAQVPYHFQVPDDIPPVVSTDAGYDILTMDCLAANGYGQWTSSSSATNENGVPSCFLLSNKLNPMPTPGSVVWDDAQTGVLAAKPFTYTGTDGYPSSDVMKVAANLKGNVRYVWIDNDSTSGRNSFYVEGFDPGSSGIDISFSRLPGNDSIVQPTHATGVFVPLMTGHQLVNSANEANPQDRFDCAIDASYLYIVWEEKTGGVYTIWGAVVKLSNDSVVMAATKITPTFGGGAAGRRPTVAVNIRNSGSIAHFDVAYLDTTIPSNTGNVWWTEYNGTFFPPPLAVPKLYSGSSSWEAPEHARILVASENGVTPSALDQRGIYLITGTGCASTWTSCHKHLFLERIYNGVPSAFCQYCDGFNNNSRAVGSPVEQGGIFYYFDVDDNPICAFANPYEGHYSNSDSLDFTEFHCLYQINRGGYGILNSNNPLMIIPGNHVTSGYCVNGKNVLSQFYGDPTVNTNGTTAYCAAVNQMGVHVHWIIDSSSVNVHYYRRDKREFDQNIEENTLMTDTCVIGNTESGVGSASDTVLSNLFLTVYTDPDTVESLDVVSLGWLDFDNGVTLNIGSSIDSGSDLVIVGGYYSVESPIYWGQKPGLSDPFSCSTNSWAINVAANNAMDDYGYADFFGSGQITLTGSGETLSSTKFGNYVSAISDPAKCNIHNASLNLIPCDSANNINITATDAIFDFQGNDVTFAPYFPGKLVTYSNGSFTNCQFKPDSSSAYFGYSVLIQGNGTWNALSGTGTGDGNYNTSNYFAAENHTVTFTSCWATTGIEIEAYQPIAPASVVVSGGEFDSAGIAGGVLGGAPWWPVSITNAAFDHIDGQAIVINEELPAMGLAYLFMTQRYSIDIENNDIKSFASGTGISGFTPYSSGIMIANAPDTTLADSLREAITVTHNVFESAGSEEHGVIDAAIHFQNATGDIGFNSITADDTLNSKYKRGIWNESSLATSPSHMTWTFICSDTVSGLFPDGRCCGCCNGSPNCALYTDWYKGYAKLNFFTRCLYGQVSSINDIGHIDFSTYTNMGYGVYEGVNHSITDLSGVHSTDTASSSDAPAQNTFNSGIQLYDSATVYLGLEPGTPTWTAFGENSFLGYPTFDISYNSGSINLGDISNNYWGGGIYNNLDVAATGGFLTTQPTLGSVECSSGLDIAKKKGADGLSILKFNKTLNLDTAVDTSMAACAALYNHEYWLSQDNDEPQAYDSAKAFLEDCPFYPEAWRAFSDILDDASTGAAGGWAPFLVFLKQVLYLNPDTGGWYCSDVNDMLSAVANAPDAEAICRYILASGKCPAFEANFESYYSSAINTRHTAWLDSIYRLWPLAAPYWADSVNKDTLRHPFADTAVPTLFQDSLQILMGPQYASAVGASSPVTSQALLSAQLLENPMQDEIDISYQMGRTALVTMELRDVLGRSVPIANAKYQLEQPGDHTATIPAPNLPPGTYYLRITTDVGDAITLKIVKE